MDRTKEDFQRVEAIFNETLGAPRELRADLLKTRCNEDFALAEQVRLLLDACDVEEQMMATGRQQQSDGRDHNWGRKTVGPYEIDRLLGRGGMGAVYLAHRIDGHFKQKVAIKLIEGHFTTDNFRERFRQERQILAGLQHPYIARLLDGGVTANGELYLVMEYVDGVSIHRFCDERRLHQTERIELILRVCEAVQFAHQNLVVHRDLKPDNILVAQDGTPRLLDFGTAKLISPSLDTPDSQLTRDGYLSFTPQFASPEQVNGNPITTASDTYSLGVLLYLLLTGAPPYDLKELTMGEMLRTVCEEAPRRPTLRGGGSKRLDADLEAILLKALRKEPHERYLTAERLADDLRAYREGQPVAARRGTARYRAGKFIRRHRWGLAATAVLLVTLFAGVVGIAWQSQVANRERRKAEARSADLRQLSNSFLTELDTAIMQIPGSTSAQKLLVTSVLNYLDRMAKDAHGDRQTQLDLAEAYTRLGNLQGNPYVQNLGDTAGALDSINRAIALSAPFAGRDSADHEALHIQANAQLSRSKILLGVDPIEKSIASTQEAIAMFNRMAATPGTKPDELLEMANAYNILGDELGVLFDYSLNDPPAALAAYRKYIELNNQELKMNQDLASAKMNLIKGQVKIAGTEMDLNPESSLKDARLGLESIAVLPKADRDSFPMSRAKNALLMYEGQALTELGRYSESSLSLKGVIESFQKLVKSDPQDMRALDDLETSLSQEINDYETAADPALTASPGERRRNLLIEERLLTQEMGVLNKIMSHESSPEPWVPYLADAQVRLGSTRSILYKGDDNTALVQEGLSTYKDQIEKAAVSSTILDDAAQDFLFAEPHSLKDPKLALSCAERAVSLSHRKLPSQLLTLAQAYRAAGQSEKSQDTAKEGLALLPALQPGSVKPRIRKLLEIQARN